MQSSWAKDVALSGIYNLMEKVQAAYSSLSIQINDKTSMKFGLRYEYTNSNLRSETQKNLVDRKYSNLFPSLFFSRTMQISNSFTFAYSRRITRPTFNDMAPFVTFTDPYTFFSGNPALQPSITDALNTSYTYKRKVISFSYSYSANPITNFTPKVDPVTNTVTLAAENQKNQKTAAVSISLPFKVTKCWNMQNNIIATWQQLNAFYNNEDVRLQQRYVNLSSTQSFTLPKDFSLEILGNYFSGGLIGLYKVKPYGFLDAGVQKKFIKHKSALRFNVGNILNSNVSRISIDLPDKNLAFSGRLQASYPSIRLTYTKNFGSEQVKAKRNRPTGAEEEKKRVQ